MNTIVEKAKKLDVMKYERIGIISGVDLIAIKSRSGCKAVFRSGDVS